MALERGFFKIIETLKALKQNTMPKEDGSTVATTRMNATSSIKVQNSISMLPKIKTNRTPRLVNINTREKLNTQNTIMTAIGVLIVVRRVMLSLNEACILIVVG